MMGNSFSLHMVKAVRSRIRNSLRRASSKLISSYFSASGSFSGSAVIYPVNPGALQHHICLHFNSPERGGRIGGEIGISGATRENYNLVVFKGLNHLRLVIELSNGSILYGCEKP